MNIYVTLVITILFLASCDFDPKDEYSKKNKIGSCQENEGMSTFEADLYSDSTFYQYSDPLTKYSYGEFKLNSRGITFNTLGGEQNLCPEYIYDNKNNIYISTKDCHSDPIVITWFKNNSH
jgi:hypothetical protein